MKFVFVLFFGGFVFAFSGGNGSLTAPYIIDSANDLLLVNENLAACYSLNSNIEIAESFSSLIAVDSDVTTKTFDGNAFTGTFFGNGHSINVNIQSDVHYAGLFGKVGQDAAIFDLKIVGDISTTESVFCAGLLAGFNKGLLLGCEARANATFSLNTQYAAAMVGYNEGDIQYCSCLGEISGAEKYCGGVVGCNATGTISNSLSYVRLDIISGVDFVGGIAGYSSSTINYCLFAGDIIRGGLQENRYGYIVGKIANASIYDCHWLSGTAPSQGWAEISNTLSGNVSLFTEQQYLSLENFSGWDFAAISNATSKAWRMSGDGPMLYHQGKFVDFNKDGFVDLKDYAFFTNSYGLFVDTNAQVLPCDANYDCVVDFQDLFQFASYWLQ